jgi:hypothetical protein
VEDAELVPVRDGAFGSEPALAELRS